MKPCYILSTILSTVVIVSSSAIASAVPMELRYPLTGKDSYPVCYIQLDNGSTLDLSEICGFKENYYSSASSASNISGGSLSSSSSSGSVQLREQSGNRVSSSNGSLGSSSSGGRESRK